MKPPLQAGTAGGGRALDGGSERMSGSVGSGERPPCLAVDGRRRSMWRLARSRRVRRGRGHVEGDAAVRGGSFDSGPGLPAFARGGPEVQGEDEGRGGLEAQDVRPEARRDEAVLPEEGGLVVGQPTLRAEDRYGPTGMDQILGGD